MRYRRLVIVLSAALVLCLAASNAVAQTVTGTLSGHVTDKTGAVVPKAKVTAVNTSTGLKREAVANDGGYFLITFLPLGTYDLTVAETGFRPVQKRGVVVELNKNTVSDFVLDVGTVTTEVEVHGGETPLINTTSGEISNTLNDEQIAATPLSGRNMISLVEQIPGFQVAPFQTSSNNPTNSTGSYAAFSGQGTRSSTFQIDGVNNDDSSENQNRQGVNVSSIKAFQVLTNAYSAEFGRAGGAVILVQTKSGTNAYHGDLYNYIQNDIFNANDYFVNAAGGERPPVRRNQYGGTIGGPILKDKLFFFGSVERVSNVGKGSMSRFVWLPSDGPRACEPGETPQPGGPYCLVPEHHPNMARDLAFIQSVMNLWNTPELQGKAPNDEAACAQLIASGRPNRCVKVTGLGFKFPDSDYSGRLDWNTSSRTTMFLRYQYSRQLRQSPRIVMGDNFGTVNNRQYNIGLTLTHVFTPTQTGEFRYGFGNRNTNQSVTDGDTIPTVRFNAANTLTNPAAGGSDTLNFGGTVIGTSTNVPINRFQRDHQLVYNHSLASGRHTFRMGVDQRFQALDDIASGTQRGFWTFNTFNTAAQAQAGTGFTSWESFLIGHVAAFQIGYGLPRADNRFGETNLYLEDHFRLRPNLTLNLGVRWEGVRAPNEIEDRYSYGYGGDWNNFQPRVGFAWSPNLENTFLAGVAGKPGDFVIRGGYGIYHGRIFQSIFSQSGLNFRFQPPNGFFLGSIPNPCATNPSSYAYTTPSGTVNVAGRFLEVSDPTCGFVFTPGEASRSVEAQGGGVRVAGGTLLTSLLVPDTEFHLPYVQQWNLTVERQLPAQMALQISYNGNRGIGLPFFSGINDAQFPIISPLVSVDVGGGVFRPVIFDRVCRDLSDPICTNGALTAFSALTSTTATLAQKGIVIVNGEPHGYISSSTPRVGERRPDPTIGRNVHLSNFAFTYYNAAVVKLTKRTARGLTLNGFWTWSKTMDTGSEATFTGTDQNAPVGAANPQRSLRGISSFHQAHRFVVSGSYELPWMRDQEGFVGRLVGGWTVSGVTTFASGLPFTVLAGYDVNMDGVGGDRPVVLDASVLGTSVDAGRPQDPCPPAALLSSGRCLASQSELQISRTAFADPFSNTRPLAPGENFPSGVAPRNGFFRHGQRNVDLAVAKSVAIKEGMGLQLRMELFNAFNRVTFGAPIATTNSTLFGRISSTANLNNYVNSGRSFGARMGQLAIRFTF